MKSLIKKSQALSISEKNIAEELKGKELWGDIAVSEVEYENLKERLKNVLESNIASILGVCRQFPLCITTFLIFMVRYRYDTNFWGLMCEELGISGIDGVIEGAIGSCTRKAFTKYGFDYSDVKDERRKNLEPILFEAGLPPESSLDDLFYILNYDLHSIFDPQLIIDDLLEMRSYQIRKPMLRFLQRFNGDRAIEFVLEVHDAMISVNQNRPGESHYIGKFINWKEKERTKEAANTRKKKEFQARPYLVFDNGKYGLSIVLPRIIMKEEWIAEVAVIITGDSGFETKRTLTVFGDEERRYTESIVVPVSPSCQYKIVYYDNEGLDDNSIIDWAIDGIQKNGFIMFNANGRLINQTYLQNPYGIIILSGNASITKSSNINISHQVYPTDRAGYDVLSVEPLGCDAAISISSNIKDVLLNARPQIGLTFEGKTLFSLPESNRLFSEIPILKVMADEGSNTNGLEIRFGKESIFLDELIENGTVEIVLKKYMKNNVNQYGTYSVRLYQYNHFLKQIEFCYLPKIETNYCAKISWPDSIIRKQKKQYWFENNAEWDIEFENCVVYVDEARYTVECPSNLGAISGVVKSNTDKGGFYCKFELPVNPFEIEILDSTGNVLENSTDKINRLGLNDIEDNNYWLSFYCFGDFKNYGYLLKLRTVNGIEQEEKLSTTINGCVNYSLASFYDTLHACPLPAQLELYCINDEEKVLPLLIVSDTVQLKTRPVYYTNGFVVVGLEEGKKDLIVKRFGREIIEQTLLYSESRLDKLMKLRGYLCKEKLCGGLYSIENNMQESNFVFEDDEGVTLSNGNNVLYVSSRGKDAKIETFSDWLDWLVKDILRTGVNNDLHQCGSYVNREKISYFKDVELSECDFEILVALAFFVNDKCVRSKQEDIKSCMQEISTRVLNGESRLELIRFISNMECPQEVFDICMQEYSLLIFKGGSDDAKLIAEKIERYSTELSMLLIMSINEPIRKTLGRDKYIELIGKDAIKSLLTVPGKEKPAEVLLEQKLFLREQSPSKVKIALSNEVVGDMESIQQMLEITYNSIYFNKAKKPDFGIYFAHIRYVDQYVNWYSLSHTCDGEMYPWKKQKMLNVVQEECVRIVDCMKELKTRSKVKEAAIRYERALKSRFNGDPMADIKSAKYNRYFYLQGLAAFLAMIPPEYNYGWATRTGERFMAQAFVISPRISRRDLIMAGTFLYLMRKEDELCR